MSERLRFSTAQAAEYGSVHPQTILKALQSGALHGGQRRPNGRWSIRRECLDAWLDGQPCEHEGRKSA